MRLLQIAVLVLISVSLAGAKDTDLFPSFKGRTLNGKSVQTDQLRGKPHLVAVGFERAHGNSLRGWAEGFRGYFPSSERADYLEIAAMPGKLSFMRGFLESQMRKDLPDSERSRIATIFAADSICKALQIKDRKRVYVYLLDAEGKILDTASGDPDPAVLSRFKQRLESNPAGTR